MRYKHIIWDYDGTLFDTYPAMAFAFKGALKEYGIIEPEENIIAHMKVSMGDTLRHYDALYSLGDAFLDRFKALSNEAQEASAVPFDGVVEICHAIRENGGSNYLLTHRGMSAARFIENVGLSDCFAELVTSRNGFPRKPSPDGILYLIEKHGIKGDEAIMIGDRELDIMAGKNAGISACFFGDSLCDAADYNIRGYFELYNILEIKRER